MELGSRQTAAHDFAYRDLVPRFTDLQTLSRPALGRTANGHLRALAGNAVDPAGPAQDAFSRAGRFLDHLPLHSAAPGAADRIMEALGGDSEVIERFLRTLELLEPFGPPNWRRRPRPGRCRPLPTRRESSAISSPVSTSGLNCSRPCPSFAPARTASAIPSRFNTRASRSAFCHCPPRGRSPRRLIRFESRSKGTTCRPPVWILSPPRPETGSPRTGTNPPSPPSLGPRFSNHPSNHARRPCRRPLRSMNIRLP